MKTVVWFGNAGSKYGDFGIPNLRIAVPGLIAASAHIPLRLLVVSNDEAKFSAVTAGLPFPCTFKAWARTSALDDIATADLCIVPNSRDRFSLAKSANRLVLALNLGVPVVATSTPSAEPLRPFVIFDDWEGGIATYLVDSARAKADVAAAQAFIALNYAPDRMADQWARLLVKTPPDAAGPKGAQPVMALIEAVEDVDDFFALHDLVGAASAHPLVAGIATDFAAGRPELIVKLSARGVQLRLLSRRDVLKGRVDLDGLRGVIALGGRSSPRRAARALIRCSVKRGIPSYPVEDLFEQPELRSRLFE